VLWGVPQKEAVKAQRLEGFAFSGVLWFGTRPIWGPGWTSFSGVGSPILRGRTGPGYEGRPTWWGRKDLNGERGELEMEEVSGRGSGWKLQNRALKHCHPMIYHGLGCDMPDRPRSPSGQRTKTMIPRILIALFFISQLWADDGMSMHLGYKSNQDCYVAITLIDKTGRVAVGLIETIEFTIDDEGQGKIIQLLAQLKDHHRKEYGDDVKIVFSSKDGLVSYDDVLDGNDRIKIYKEVISLLGVKIPSGYGIPDKFKD
jgi:hypothetical protein